MREFKNETIIITKEAWCFLKNENRKKAGCAPLNEEQLEKCWGRMYRNNGANYEQYPIADNEIRIERDSFNFRLEQVIEMLTENGYTFRQDGFIAEGIYV